MAALSRPPASQASPRGSQYLDLDSGRHMQQAGRSATNLAAQSSAQTLRSSSRPGSRSQPAAILHKRDRPVSEASSTADSAVESPLQPPAHRPIPRQPSPLNPTASHGSDNSAGSRKNSDDAAPSTSSSEEQQQRGKTAAAAAAALLPPDDQIHTQLQPLLGSLDVGQQGSTTSLTRPPTPKTVRDLGSDYTRYYNPFATQNNSQQDLTAPLPRYHSTTHLSPADAVPGPDLQKRLSDPFNNTKRLSNPFESRQNTAPGTPLKKQISPDKEKAALAAAGIPARSGTPQFISEADPEKAAFYPYMDDRLGAPEYAFPLFTDEKEDDDEMHMPRWDDEVRLKPKLRDHFSRGNICSTLGLILMIVGLLCVFVVLPAVSYTTTGLIPYTYDTPLSQMPKTKPQPEPWATVNNRTYAMMKNVRLSLIDPDTPSSAKKRIGVHGDEYVLVFSDEFNAQNRSFWEGDDPYWFGFNGWYGATQDLEWYDPDAINTGGGTLQLQLDQFASHNLNYRSGMLNSWNQLCFKGGIFEVSMSLPGPAGVHSWWPGVWTMGNLGRPGYLATTDGMWPYTYNTCDSGITPNQSMTDGTSNLPGQRLASCTCSGEDHPTPGTGRGAPEIDIAEVSGDWGGHGWGVATQSYQVAPFDVWYYPNYEYMETPNYNLSFVNTYTGGPYQQAVSTTSMLNNLWYDGQQYQKYSFEYVPGSDRNAYVAWVIGEDETMRFDARSVGPNGNVGQRLISEEPMSLVMNLGFSHAWVDIDMAHLKFPTIMRIDYVRWYQKHDKITVTCDPPGYETTEYIANHPAAYQNPNYTHWTDTGYSWPKNKLMNGCH